MTLERCLSILCIFVSMKIIAIVVTYNAAHWLDRCLSSLRSSSVPLDVIVVDNCSSDDTTSRIERDYPEVELVRNTANLGFGQANNAAMAKALNRGADFVLLLNQDAWIFGDTVEKLVAASRANPKAAIVSPVHLDASEKALDLYFSKYIIDNEVVGVMPNAAVDRTIHQRNAAAMHRNARKRAEAKRDALVVASTCRSLRPRGVEDAACFAKEPFAVPFVNAAAWLLPRQTMKTIGGFDPIFFHYGEDRNYAQRVEYHGLETVVVPEAFVVHDRLDVVSAPANSSNWMRSHLLVEWCNINVSLFSAALKSLPVAVKMLLLSFFGTSARGANARRGLQVFLAARPRIPFSRKVNRRRDSSWL